MNNKIKVGDGVLIKDDALLMFTNNKFWINNSGLPDSLKIKNGVVIKKEKENVSIVLSKDIKESFKVLDDFLTCVTRSISSL